MYLIVGDEGGVSFKRLKTPQKCWRRRQKHMVSYLHQSFLPYINIWDQKVQTSVFYEAFLPITWIEPSGRYEIQNEITCRTWHHDASNILDGLPVVHHCDYRSDWTCKSQFALWHHYVLSRLVLSKTNLGWGHVLSWYERFWSQGI